MEDPSAQTGQPSPETLQLIYANEKSILRRMVDFLHLNRDLLKNPIPLDGKCSLCGKRDPIDDNFYWCWICIMELTQKNMYPFCDCALEEKECCHPKIYDQ